MFNLLPLTRKKKTRAERREALRASYLQTTTQSNETVQIQGGS